MTIIVTGGAGFIGSNYIFYLLEKYPEDRIVCLDKLTYAGNLSTLKSVMDNPRFRFVRADICDREAVFALCDPRASACFTPVAFVRFIRPWACQEAPFVLLRN